MPPSRNQSTKKKRRGFLLRKNRHKQSANNVKPVGATVLSLGSGMLSQDGNALMEFQPKTPTPSIASNSICDDSSTVKTKTKSKTRRFGRRNKKNKLLPDTEKIRDNIACVGEKVGEHMERVSEQMERITERLVRAPTHTFTRLTSTFIRVADLQLTKGTAVVHPYTITDSSTDDSDETTPITTSNHSLAHFHHASPDPPPGVDHDPKEEWIALDDGAGSAAPIAPYAVAELSNFGYKTAMDATMWKCEGKTEKVLKHSDVWTSVVWQEKGLIRMPETYFDAKHNDKDEVMVWSGNFIHGLYGSDLPAVRALGVVNMSPRALTELMVDSNRCKEYNKMSVGRDDLMVLQDNLFQDDDATAATTDPAAAAAFGKSVTKVMRAETQPPMVRKPLQLVTLMHVTALDNDSGYLLVSRAVTQATEAHDTSLRSEILMGVNVIRGIEGQPNKCLMINVNHIRTPMIPIFLGRKIGLAAAPNFIRDLRNLPA